jgi:hypothetical protein
VIRNVKEIYTAKDMEMDNICSTYGITIHAYKMENLMGGAMQKTEIWLVH